MSERKEIKGYTTLPEEDGNIHISEEVIATIAVAAVREVEGISGMVTGVSGAVSDLVTKKTAAKGLKGVKVEMAGEAMALDVHVTVKYGFSIPEVAENAQKAIINSVEAMTGCAVAKVNIHVEGVSVD